MSTSTSSSRTSSVQWLTESRPPSLTWSRPSPPQSNQPPLDFADHEPDHLIALPNDRGLRVSVVKAHWAARQRAGLPDAREWSTALALAVIQALLGQRPAAQANWLVCSAGVGLQLVERSPSGQDLTGLCCRGGILRGSR
jgi:hypothetical protein